MAGAGLGRWVRERDTVQTVLARVEGFIQGREGERGERKGHRVALWEERVREKEEEEEKESRWDFTF